MVEKYLALHPEDDPSTLVVKWKCKGRARGLISPDSNMSVSSSSSESSENEELMEMLGYNEMLCPTCNFHCRDLTGTINWSEETSSESEEDSQPSAVTSDAAMQLHRSIVSSKAMRAELFMAKVDRVIAREFSHLHDVSDFLTKREFVYKIIRRLNSTSEQYPDLDEATLVRICEKVEDPFHLNAAVAALSPFEAVHNISGGILRDILQSSS